jgi:hypothetical protein
MTEVINGPRRTVLTGAVAVLVSAGLAQGGTPASNHLRRITMNILRSGSLASSKGPAEYFTGAVRIDMPFKDTAPARIGGAIVTFEPGARTAWHTHPLDPDRHLRLGLGANGGRPQGGHQGRRYRLDSAG